MTLGTRVAVLNDGKLKQVDTPQLHVRRPGEPVRGGLHRQSPATNLVEGQTRQDQGPGLEFAGHKVPLPAELVFGAPEPGRLRRQAAHRRAPPVRPRGRRPGCRLAQHQGRSRGHRGTGLRGQRDLPHGRPPGPSRRHGRQVRQGGQGRGRGRRAGRRGPVALDGPGESQDPSPCRPQHRPGHRHFRVPLLRLAHTGQAIGRRHRGRRRPRTT